MKIKSFLILIISFISFLQIPTYGSKPLKIAIIGLSHSHVHGLLGRANIGDVEIIAIVEKDIELSKRMAKDYNLPNEIFFTSSEEMLKSKMPDAVAAFGSIYDHLNVVKTFAPLGIHVMVEKPLAVSLEHAKEMKKLADKNNIHLITNYETTWYPTNQLAYKMVDSAKIGELRKLVVHDGHQGPKEIGVNKEFLDWLTDPVLNGGGAVTDFGCYGADLVTWLMKGVKPISVTAVTQTIKPEIYSKVDDEATIILKYPEAQAIIQASWNWPFSRKDIEIYGQSGYIICDNKFDLRYRLNERETENRKKLTELPKPYNDPFSFFAAMINGEIKLQPYDLSSLETNIIVVEILDAAKLSSKTGKAVYLK